MKLYNFKCESSQQIYEKLTNDARIITCNCGSKANRTLSAPKYFGNTVGKSPATK